MAVPAVEVITVVDLRLLSHAEISSLSRCSSNAFDLRRCDDVVVDPKIDRSVFNESAGSRKQTYSRLRLAPHKPDPSTVASSRPRGLFPSSPRPSSSSSFTAPVDPSLADAAPAAADEDHPDRGENLRIISYLRQLFAREEPSPQP